MSHPMMTTLLKKQNKRASEEVKKSDGNGL